MINCILTTSEQFYSFTLLFNDNWAVVQRYFIV
jgi:hypothetical protein